MQARVRRALWRLLPCMLARALEGLPEHLYGLQLLMLSELLLLDLWAGPPPLAVLVCCSLSVFSRALCTGVEVSTGKAYDWLTYPNAL